MLAIALTIIALVGGVYYYSTQNTTTTTTPFEIVGNVDHFDASYQPGSLAIYINVGGGALAPVLARYESVKVISGYQSVYCIGLQMQSSPNAGTIYLSQNIAKVCLGDFVIVYVTHTTTSDVIISIIDTTTHTQTP